MTQKIVPSQNRILATLIYVTKADKTLMLFRNKKVGDIHAQKYNGVGGKFEKDESPLECAKRELLEETGLNLISAKFKGHLLFPNFDKEGRDWLVFVYRVDQFSGELIICNEGELQWIDNERLINLPLWDGDKYFLPYIHTEKSFDGVFFYTNGLLQNHRLEIY
jgi:8-oxo-dGTP diphosphatase